MSQNIFTIPNKSGRNRPAIDMRVLSGFVEHIPFRMKDISLLKSVLKQGDFRTKHDLREAYLTVPVDKNLRIYLHLEGCALTDSLASFLVCLLQQNFHQSNETSDSISKSHGDQIIKFSGQHFDHGKLSRVCNATHRLRDLGIVLLGVCDKQNPFSSLQRGCHT